MKVTMIRTPAASFNCPLSEGETGDLNQPLAERLIGLGLAEQSTESTDRKDHPELRGVPEDPPTPEPAETLNATDEQSEEVNPYEGLAEADAIRQVLGENPDASNKDVITELQKYGFEVQSSQVSRERKKL